MCILSYLPAGIDVDSDALWNGGINNPDGHGWAIAEPRTGEMLIGKSLELADALESFEVARKAHPDAPALFHSRWATHGSITVPNCHPFYVGNSKRTVVGHNGILPSDAHPRKGDDRSDTRLFADDILSTRFRRLDKQRAFFALSQWAGSYNKLVILTTDPRYRRNAYLVNESAGNWDSYSGIWHSNHDYLGIPKWLENYGRAAAVTIGGKAQLPADDDANCLMCNYGYVNAAGFCSECGTCQDCFESTADCLCYWQGIKDRANTWDLVQGDDLADYDSPQ